MRSGNGSRRRPVRALMVLTVALFLLSACSLPFSFLEPEPPVQEPVGNGSWQSAPVKPVKKKKIRLSETLHKLLQDPLMSEEYQDNVYEGETLYRNAATWYYYYTLLDDTEKAIYDSLLSLLRNPTSTEYRKGIWIENDPVGEAFQYQIARAYQAILFDHAELFWLRKKAGMFCYYYLSQPYPDGRYLVMLELCEPYTEYEEEVTAFNNAVDAFLADIDTTQEAPYVAMDIYDKLMDMVRYDHVLAEQDLDVAVDEVDYGFTAYGALVANSRGEANCAVCDGYSYAYAYLLQQVGIPAMRISGYVGHDPSDMDAHSWNLLQLDGEWYEADATWDDQELDYDPNDPYNAIFFEAAEDPYYWGRIRHHLFLLTTEEMNCVIPTDEDVFYTDHGSASFLDTVYHARDTEEVAEQPDSGDHLSYRAPIATGTQYSWEQLFYGEEEAGEDVYEEEYVYEEDPEYIYEEEPEYTDEAA